MTPVLVKWVDIASHDGAWMDLEEAKAFKPLVVETCGWIVVDTDDYITVVSSRSSEGEVTGSVNSIPKGCVVGIQNLRPYDTQERRRITPMPPSMFGVR